MCLGNTENRLGENRVIEIDKFNKSIGRNDMKIERIWSMPNKWTFTIKPIRELLKREVSGYWCDPFAGENSPAQVKNDLSGKCEFKMDALEFLKTRRERESSMVSYLTLPTVLPRRDNVTRDEGWTSWR